MNEADIVLKEKNGNTGVFIGLSCIDITYYSNEQLPESNTKKKISEYEVQAGGPATNAALTFAMMGNRSVLVTCIGDSPAGMLLKGELEKNNIIVIDLDKDRALPDIAAVFVEKENGSRTVFSGQGEKELHNTETLDRIISTADIVEYDGNLLGIEDVLMEYIIKYDKKLVLDMGSFKKGFGKCMNKNCIAISSKDYKNEDGSTVLKNEDKYYFCAVTNEEKDIDYIYNKKAGKIPVPQIKAVDTLGAGDILHGSFMHYMLKGKDPVKALSRAAGFASAFVSVRGIRDGIRKAMSIVVV